MRLTDVNIDRFGVWRDLHVPLSDSGVSLFYGPNEAGKSTLMRFVRGVLYGFRPPSEGREQSAAAQGDALGELRIVQDGREHIIRREANAGERLAGARGRARFDNLDWGKASEARIRQLVRDTNESLYENVFAIGLSELQELASLNDEEVSQHIYGMSLGPEGERVLHTRGVLVKQRQRLLTDDRKAGEIVRLAGRLEELDRELAEIGDVSHKHQHLRAERDRLTAEIDATGKRRAELERQLRGHRFMERVYTPWLRERQLRNERDALPLLGSLPEDGLKRFDDLERERDQHQSRRSLLLEESERLDREADELAGDTDYYRHECTIRRLSDHREELRHQELRLHEKQSRVEALDQKLRARLSDLGSGWTVDRLKNMPLPANGLNRLWDAARRYQSAASKRGRSVRRYKKVVASSQKRQADFNEQIKSLGGTPLTTEVHAAQRRLNDIRELSRLRIEEARLSAQLSAVPRRLSLQSEIHELPPLFYVLMGFFAIAGFVLFLAGLWGAWSNSIFGAHGTTAIIVGLIYSCFGLCMAGSSWTVKQHLEQYYTDPEETGAFRQLGDQQSVAADPHAAHNLNRVQQSIRELVGSTDPVPRSLGISGESSGEIDESDVLMRTAQRLVDLQRLLREEQQILNRRNRLSRYREVLRGRQRDVSQRRRDWCDTLRDLNIDETLKVDKALTMWQTISDAHHIRRAAALVQDEVTFDQRSLDQLRKQTDRLLEELPHDAVVGLKSDPDQIITRWRSQTRKLDGGQDKRSQLRKQARDKRREADTVDSTLHELFSQRSSLLGQAGASSRAELETRMRSLSRHRELARLLSDVQTELRTAAEAEPELAVVEEDLLAFDASSNKRQIERIDKELKQIDHDRQAAHEDLGRVKHELQELAGDRRAVGLRFEREQLAADLAREMETWCAIDLSMETVDHIRQRIERHAQSETLQLASQFMDRLTCGKYPNIWAPLGERHLCIDDDAEQTLRVEQLSTGTREQLFLAIRLAMIRRFAEEGTELPMVLDDVFVNFDQLRTEAAVDTILDFADQGQQILLFTCHLHLAHMFEAKGIDPVWLPVNAAVLAERRAG